MQPQAALTGFFTTAPSVLTLSQFERGACQITSLTMGTFGGCMLIFRALRNTNSVMSTATVLAVLFPEIEVWDIIKFIATFHVIFLFWNLPWFLTYHIVLIMLIKQDLIATLH